MGLICHVDEPWYGEEAVIACFESKHFMRKTIDYDGYNVAEILEMYENGDVRTNVFEIENEEVIRYDTNIVFAAGTIEFTEEEVEMLKPMVKSEEQSSQK